MLLTLKEKLRKAETGAEPFELFSTMEDMRAAIRAVLFDASERVDIRHLWTRGSVSYFRVNRWSAGIEGPARIVRSSFMVVEALDSGWRVRERHGPLRPGALPMASRERRAA